MHTYLNSWVQVDRLESLVVGVQEATYRQPSRDDYDGRINAPPAWNLSAGPATRSNPSCNVTGSAGTRLNGFGCRYTTARSH